jgi:hypothetical protein
MTHEDVQITALAVAAVVPTIAVLALFIRLGVILQTIRRIEGDYGETAKLLREVSGGMTSLMAWREAQSATHEDILSRVRRLEDRALGGHVHG